MALASYSDVLGAPNKWLRRTDLTPIAPDWVALAEARMNRALRVSLQLVRGTLSLGAEFVAKPAGFRQLRSLRLTSGTSRQLREVTPEQMAARKAVPSVLTGEPREFTALGAQFELWPVPDVSYSAAIEYQATIPALTTGNPSNWILADHPDAYLFGVLAGACAYLKQDERAAGFDAKFEAVVDDIQYALRTSYDRRLRVDPALTAQRSSRTFNIFDGDAQ